MQMVLRGNGGDTSPATSLPWSISKGSQVETGVEHVSVIRLNKGVKGSTCILVLGTYKWIQ